MPVLLLLRLALTSSFPAQCSCHLAKHVSCTGLGQAQGVINCSATPSSTRLLALLVLPPPKQIQQTAELSAMDRE